MTMHVISQNPVDQNYLHAVHAFYADYTEALDDGRLKDWPGFFAQDCLYQIIPRENHETNSELCIMQADGMGMLVDRVQGITRTQKYGPQVCRRFYSGLRIVRVEGDLIHTRQNVLAIQSLIDAPSSILLCGVTYDQLRVDGGRLLIRQRIVVSDTDLVDSALIFPI